MTKTGNNEPARRPKYLIVGGGPAGALMAAYLGRDGYEVDVYEMRPDLRTAGAVGGRSINLALSHRGLCALEGIGLARDVLKLAVPMRGRMIHHPNGSLKFQPYGKDASQAIHSVSRGGLNMALLNAADQHASVRLHFDQRCTDVNPDTGLAEFTHVATGEKTSASADVIVGADGAFSAVRRRMQRLDRFNFSQTYLEHGYKELTIPAAPDGGFLMEKNALHIWPRRSLMMIALPNEDGTYTCTLFWPLDGPLSFDALKTQDDVLAFFKRTFPDAVPLVPTLAEDYFRNPTSTLATIRSGPWFYRDKVVMVGDACHAVVPFYGQGMNAAFEDVLVLSECLAQYGDDREAAFRTYDRRRREDVNVLADLALSNFIEMRDHTGKARFLFKKKLEQTLHRVLGKAYIPLYTMATFTRMPYTQAVRRAKKQDRIVCGVAAGLVLGLVLAILAWAR